MKRILIAGIGNVLLADDGIGPLIVQTIASRYECGNDVDVEDLGTPGLELADYLADLRAVILVDSIVDEQPGAIKLFRKQDILACRVPIRTGPHAPSLAESLVNLDLIDAAPEEILLVGIAGQNYELGAPVSDCVRSSVGPAIAAIFDELARLQIVPRQRVQLLSPQIWWEKGSGQ